MAAFGALAADLRGVDSGCDVEDGAWKDERVEGGGRRRRRRREVMCQKSSGYLCVRRNEPATRSARAIHTRVCRI